MVCLYTTDPTVLTEVAERLLQVVPAPIEVDGVVHQVGLSVGVAVGTADSSSLHALVREADAALYRAKRAGRGRIEWAGAPAGH